MKNNIYKIFAMLLTVSVVFYSCDLEEEGPAGPSKNPSPSSITPEQGPGNEFLTLEGSGLGDIRSIIFATDSVSAMINPTLNTDATIMFRVPQEAIPGEQNIVLINGAGVQFTVPFKVLGFAAITKVSNYNFSENEELVLEGKNLTSVSAVRLIETDEEATVVGSTATTLTIKMPATTAKHVTLEITNDAGPKVASQVFVNRDLAFVLFDDDYQNGFEDGSWAASAVNTTVFKSGTASKDVLFVAGNWSICGFGWTDRPNDNYEYFTFWVKGGAADYDLYIQSQQSESGWDTFFGYNKITVPADVWSYYKIPVKDLKLWANGDAWNQIAWRIQGPDGGDLTFHFDDVMFTYAD